MVNYDPTNDSEIGRQYISVGVGRDYGDVSPLKGIYSGGDPPIWTWSSRSPACLKITALDPVQIVAEFDTPGELGGRQRPPLILLARQQRRHVMGEHQGADTGSRRVALACSTDEW